MGKVELAAVSDSATAKLFERAKQVLEGGVEIIVDPAEIRPMPGQPRSYFNPDSIKRLATGMTHAGQISPGLVRTVPQDGAVKYELIDGERRWRAATLAGLKYRAIAVEAEDDSIVPFIIAAIANVNREANTPLGDSDTIARLNQSNVPMDEVAIILGISSFWAIQLHGLQKLHPSVRAMMDPGLPKNEILPTTAAIQIAKVAVELQFGLATRVLEGALHLRDLRQEAVRVSHEAGTHIRQNKRAPRKQRESFRLLPGQTLRVAHSLRSLLQETGIREMMRGCTELEIETVLSQLQQTREAIESSLSLIADFRNR